jgi:hypothetical protein
MLVLRPLILHSLLSILSLLPSFVQAEIKTNCNGNSFITVIKEKFCPTCPAVATLEDAVGVNYADRTPPAEPVEFFRAPDQYATIVSISTQGAALTVQAGGFEYLAESELPARINSSLAGQTFTITALQNAVNGIQLQITPNKQGFRYTIPNLAIFKELVSRLSPVPGQTNLLAGHIDTVTFTIATSEKCVATVRVSIFLTVSSGGECPTNVVLEDGIGIVYGTTAPPAQPEAFFRIPDQYDEIVTTSSLEGTLTPLSGGVRYAAPTQLPTLISPDLAGQTFTIANVRNEVSGITVQITQNNRGFSYSIPRDIFNELAATLPPVPERDISAGQIDTVTYTVTTSAGCQATVQVQIYLVIGGAA